MESEPPGDIARRIEERYRSPESPNFSFVSEAITANPYAALVQRLDREFVCEEDTDPNDDVSFGYALRSPAGEWTLRLSMVGPYAVLLRGGADTAVEVVEPGLPHLRGAERQIVGLVEEAGIALLGRETLDRPVRLKLYNAAPDNVRVYQSLFTDTDVLPWEQGVTT